MKITELSADWAVDLRSARKSSNTVRAYLCAVKSYVGCCGDNLDDLSRHSIRQWLSSLDSRSAPRLRSGLTSLNSYKIAVKRPRQGRALPNTPKPARPKLY